MASPRFACLAVLVCTVAVCLAGNQRTQEIALTRGWNAVFLEVYPGESRPAALFSDTPVDIAACFLSSGSPAQFMTDPGVDLFSQAGWAVWYSENRPDAFLKTLHAIYGQQGFLIHAKSDFTWRVTGAVTPAEVKWQANSYNLVGFSVHPVAAPTFSQFFAGSAALRHNKIYRLASGTWRRVQDPSAENMRSGEAFWIYCQGTSDYQGPLRVETKTRLGLVLGSGVDNVVLRNNTTTPITPTITHVVNDENPVPLSIVVQATSSTNLSATTTVSLPHPKGAWTQPMPPLDGGGSRRVPFEARAAELSAPTQASLLKVTTDLGTEHWIPVLAVREDLED